MKNKLILKTFLLSVIFNVSSLYSQEALSVIVDNIEYIVSDSDSAMTYTNVASFCRNQNMSLLSIEVLMAMYDKLYKEDKGNFCACLYWSSTKDKNMVKSIDFGAYRGALIHKQNIETYQIENWVRCVKKI